MKRLVLALAACLAAPGALALDLEGSVGASYSRSDYFSPAGGDSPPSTRLDLSLGLRFRGFLYSRETLNWDLGANYRRLSWDAYADSTAVEKWIFYNGRINALSHRHSPVTLSLDASRTHSQFSTTADPDVTGETITQTTGGVFSLRVADRPSVTTGYHRISSETSTPGIGITERTIDKFTGTLNTGNAAFDLSASYAGDLSTGTYQNDRIDRHSLVVSNRFQLSPSVEVVASDMLQLAKPHELGVGTVDQESNAFRVFGWNRGDPGERHTVNYSYAHLLARTFAGPLQEGIHQGLRYDGDLLLTDPKLFTRWFVDGSVQQARSGTTELRSTGETIGFQLNWLPPLEGRVLELAAGPSIGFIQTDAGNDSTGWGVTGSGRTRFDWGAQQVNITYNAAYSSDQFGNPGWSLRQSVAAWIAGRLRDKSYNASLSASGFRTESPVFGAGLGRSLNLFATLFGQGDSVEFTASLQSGITGSTSSEMVGDGLFIPAPFDSKTLNLLLRGATTLYTGLTATGHLRYLNTSAPGRPDLNQVEAYVALRYAYGALTLALEDRVNRYEQADGWATANQVGVSISRTIGWHGP